MQSSPTCRRPGHPVRTLLRRLLEACTCRDIRTGESVQSQLAVRDCSSDTQKTQELRIWLKCPNGERRTCLASGQFTAMILRQLRHRQDSTGHRTQGHKALCPLQGHNTANEVTAKPMRQRPPAAAALQFSPLPLPWQAEPKQKAQHEKTGNQTVRRQEKGKIKSVLHIASHN